MCSKNIAKKTNFINGDSKKEYNAYDVLFLEMAKRSVTFVGAHDH
jgi:hypothetical protein